MEAKYAMSLRATAKQLKKLFRIKEEAHSTIEDFLGYEVSAGEAILISSEFYRRLMESAEGLKAVESFRLDDQDLSSSSDLADAVRSIRFNVEVSKTDARIVADNLSAVTQFLELKYKQNHFTIDKYLVLMELFRFVLLKKMAIFQSYSLLEDGEKTQDAQESNTPCDICGDRSCYFYCGANTCSKCRKFFRFAMRQRTHVSLRCAGRNNCKNEFESVDITCKKCRFQRCKELKMVDAYFFTDEAISDSTGCAICKTTAQSSHLLGTCVCEPCKQFFASSLADSTYLKYACTESRCCPVSSAEETCKFCKFYVFKELGLLELFLVKAGAEESSPDTARRLIFRSRKMCCLCDNVAQSQPWLNLPVCTVCQKFFAQSMRQNTYLAYCCPEGEAGRVCTLRLNDPIICLYCWMRRFEIEGIVDRWLICDGDPSLWNAPQKPSRAKSSGHVPVIQAPYSVSNHGSEQDMDEEDISITDDVIDEIVEEQ